MLLLISILCCSLWTKTSSAWQDTKGMKHRGSMKISKASSVWRGNSGYRLVMMTVQCWDNLTRSCEPRCLRWLWKLQKPFQEQSIFLRILHQHLKQEHRIKRCAAQALRPPWLSLTTPIRPAWKIHKQELGPFLGTLDTRLVTGSL